LINLYMGELKMSDKAKKRHTKAIGSEVSVDIWSRLRIQAIREGRKTGEVLDDAIRLYLDHNPDDLIRQAQKLRSE